MKENIYENCTLCARACRVNRVAGERGYCKMPSEPYVARIGLHMWEEPIISGRGGSGTVFFSGCSLRCVYCQNAEISRAAVGRKMSEREIVKKVLELEKNGAENINFVTPTHYAKSVFEITRIAREMGLKIPIVYNTSSYDSVKTVRELLPAVDVFIADFKYYLDKSALKYSNAENYVDTAKAAIDEMVKGRGAPVIENGIMKSGVIIRILLLPSHVAEAKLSLQYLYSRYGDSVYFSLMSQYTPMPDSPHPIDRAVTVREYSDLVEFADKLKIKNAFIQDKSSVGKNFIPDFEK